jgi:DNA-binding transcriptional ArsR family regulator
MTKDVNAIYRAETGGGTLERLSAVETLRQLRGPENVRLTDLVGYLRDREMWLQFSKITMEDLQQLGAGKSPLKTESRRPAKKKKKRFLEEELGLPAADAKREPTAPVDGGISTEQVAQLVLPFLEGNGEMTFEDLLEYTELDRKVLRFHLTALVKAEQVERIGAGKNAVFSSLG